VNDTQWPTYQVFKQDRPGAPHETAGSVHAPDAEIALQNARDVFVRRPDCASLWVAPESKLTSRTAEEMALGLPPESGAEGEPETYLVFTKIHHRGSHVYAGSVRAPSPIEAIRAARHEQPAFPVWVWWVVPDRSVTRSAPEDSASLFDGVLDKPYRDQAFYHTDTLMREIERQPGPGQGTPAAPR
jgi:ring-1,2-phenylacetyl-CoA epoxidase subunit PaaB